MKRRRVASQAKGGGRSKRDKRTSRHACFPFGTIVRYLGYLVVVRGEVHRPARMMRIGSVARNGYQMPRQCIITIHTLASPQPTPHLASHTLTNATSQHDFHDSLHHHNPTGKLARQRETQNMPEQPLRQPVPRKYARQRNPLFQRSPFTSLMMPFDDRGQGDILGRRPRSTHRHHLR